MCAENALSAQLALYDTSVDGARFSMRAIVSDAFQGKHLHSNIKAKWIAYKMHLYRDGIESLSYVIRNESYLIERDLIVLSPLFFCRLCYRGPPLTLLGGTGQVQTYTKQE